MNKKALIILSTAHLITDINQLALTSLLPFFKEALSLSYTMAGTILLFSNLISSVIQPVWGFFSDRYPRRWILPIAPFIACLGMSLSGFMPNYYLLLLTVILSGIGIAVFHPEGFRTAHSFTGETKATGMSFFMVGGSLGFAVGPIWTMTLMTSFGLKGTLGFLIPGVIVVVVLWFYTSWATPSLPSASIQTKKETTLSSLKEKRITLSLLLAIAVIRSWIQFGLLTYIPFYYINFLKGNPLYAGKLVSIYLTASVVGMLVGSPFADRWGHKKFILITFFSVIPLLLLFYYTGGLHSFLILGIAGLVLGPTFTVTLVMAQTLFPRKLAMISGLMVGFNVGAGGIGVTLFGMIADQWGVPAAMKSIILLPITLFLLSLLVKYDSTKE